MKKIYAFLSIFFLMFGFSSYSLASNSTSFINDKPQEADNTQVLFVLVSKEAAIKATEQPGVYKLTMKGVNPKVIFFSNRPERISGQIATAKFLKQWQKDGSFSHVAPNAVIEAVKLDTKTKKLDNAATSYTVVLNNPVSKKNGNELSFEIKALTGDNVALPTMSTSDYVAVFIDGVCLTCIG